MFKSDYLSVIYIAMNIYHSLSHTTWEQEYRKNLEQGFKALASQKKCQIEARHLLHHFVHILVNILTKYSVAQAVRFITGKRTIYITRIFKAVNWTAIIIAFFSKHEAFRYNSFKAQRFILSLSKRQSLYSCERLQAPF